MNAESIGYRYEPIELATLLAILRLPNPPDAPLPELTEALAQNAAEELIEAGIVLSAGEGYGVNRLNALLLSNAAHCRYHVTARAADRTVVLWRGSALFVLGEFPKSGAITLTPIRDAAAARRALQDALNHKDLSGHIVEPDPPMATLLQTLAEGEGEL
ncbi:MAG: hypothetical protein IJ234_08405 [Clostridia bacterium]|nr:hypothetical protein [Clostridia bacterium]